MQNFSPKPDISASAPHILTHDYTYTLPEEQIAMHPLAERDASKLLIADLRVAASEGNHIRLRHSTFRNLAEELPQGTMLVMNDSRVIAARIQMQKTSGGKAEVLCLYPISLVPEHKADYDLTLQAQGSTQWRCMVGGRRIQAGDILSLTFATPHHTIHLQATILRKNGSEADVEFMWQPGHITFAECLQYCGHVPLPPYIKREDEESDTQRYQTVYAAHDGSVAAPTAGLHFTDRVLSELRTKGIAEERVTLHVGAGTFKPMTSENVVEHVMHEERIYVEHRAIIRLAEQLQKHSQSHNAPVVAVGTTSMRTLESLYWWGIRLMSIQNLFEEATELRVQQWDAFHFTKHFQQTSQELPAPDKVFMRLAEWMRFHNLETLTGDTGIMIAPGYPFQVCHGLITNFHQPQSTLILLVAAFLTDESGSENAPLSHWRTVYDAALQDGYRFLSYGDSSLLWRNVS
jgi:S-adenosylmethionine:tRNA ribosyltransferase-isomerase